MNWFLILKKKRNLIKLLPQNWDLKQETFFGPSVFYYILKTFLLCVCSPVSLRQHLFQSLQPELSVTFFENEEKWINSTGLADVLGVEILSFNVLFERKGFCL